MKRNINQELTAWSCSPIRKPLILRGARQVGKTHSLLNFAKNQYNHFIYLNFERDKQAHMLFDTNLEPKTLLQKIGIHKQCKITDDTLLIFDEIQECPNALNSLKYFCEEKQEQPIVAAGSLLGVKLSADAGFPVGKVEFLDLHPMTFVEFLEAVGEEQLSSHLKSIHSIKPIEPLFHEKLLENLRYYFYIGGMPEAVKHYAEHHDLQTVRKIQNGVLDTYQYDFVKHAPKNEVMRITTVWQQLPTQLAKENKKFIFSRIRKSARGREYELAIQWLNDAGLILKCHNIKSPKLPLEAYADNTFKLYALDIGLLGAQSGLNAKLILEKDQLFSEFNGALTENFIAQELWASKQKKLFYWTSDGEAEVDFIIQENHEITPLEVKAGTSTKKKSLLVYDKKYSPKKLYRTNTMNLKANGKLINYPLYLAWKLAQTDLA